MCDAVYLYGCGAMWNCGIVELSMYAMVTFSELLVYMRFAHRATFCKQMFETFLCCLFETSKRKLNEKKNMK